MESTRAFLRVRPLNHLERKRKDKVAVVPGPGGQEVKVCPPHHPYHP